MELVNVMFEDQKTGEIFFVEQMKPVTEMQKRICLSYAKQTAEMFFDEPKLIDVVSCEMAEAMGYDIY